MSDAVRSALASQDPEERRKGVPDIVHAPEAERAALFVRALGDANWRVRKEAVGVARALSGSLQVLDALVRALGPGDNVGLRNAAVEALGSFGERAVDALRAAVPDLDADGRKLAAEALARSENAGALAVLEAMLHDDDVNVRAAVIEAVGQVGATDVERARSVLERCLVGGDSIVVLGALEGLNRLGASVAWPMLRPHLENPVLRDTVLAAAGLSGHPDAVPALVRALGGAPPRSFAIAVAALANAVGTSPALRRAARTALASASELTRRRLFEAARAGSDHLDAQRCAILAVGALGSSEAADAVIDVLADDRVAAEAHQALEMLGPAAILALARRARVGEPHERAACVEQLGELADEATHAVACQAILDATEDGAPEVVRAALVALAQIGDEGALPLAARWLTEDAPPALRHASATALAACSFRYPETARSLAVQVRPDSPAAAVAAVVIGALDEPVFESVAGDVAFLADAASNASAAVRRAALDALARYGLPQAVEAASFAVTDEASEVQHAAIRALGRMRDEGGRPVGVPHLLDAVRTFHDDDLGSAAVEALGETGDPAALDVLNSVARGGTALRAVAAVEAIGLIDDPGRVDALIQALSHSEAEVVKAALRVVAREEKDPRGAAHVAACLDHEAWDVRRLAAELLGRRADASAKHLLRQRLGSEREPLVREEIQRSLAEGEGGGPRRTVPPLGGGMG